MSEQPNHEPLVGLSFTHCVKTVQDGEVNPDEIHTIYVTQASLAVYQQCLVKAQIGTEDECTPFERAAIRLIKSGKVKKGNPRKDLGKKYPHERQDNMYWVDRGTGVPFSSKSIAAKHHIPVLGDMEDNEDDLPSTSPNAISPRVTFSSVASFDREFSSVFDRPQFYPLPETYNKDEYTC